MILAYRDVIMKRSSVIPIPKKVDSNTKCSPDLIPNPRSAESIEKHKQAMSLMEEHSKRMTNIHSSRVIEEKQKINTETKNDKISCKA